VKEQLKLLIALQEVDSSIAKDEAIIRVIPKKISSVEKPFKDAQIFFDKQKSRYEAMDKKRKDRERSLDDVNEKIKKLKARRSEIKNNKEYQAHLKEIASAEEERSAVEDEILVLMESLDVTSKELKMEEAKVTAEGTKVETFRKKLAEDVVAAEKELEEQKRRRVEIVKYLDRDIYEQYFAILGSRGGLAVVGARDEVCLGCNMNIPPQLFVELKKNEKIMHCPQCGRILYWKGEGDLREQENASVAGIR